MEAIDLARRNTSRGIRQTVLFFDEANTTNAIGEVKRVVCDRLVGGRTIPEDIGLQFVVAVNPYRQHSEVRLETLLWLIMPCLHRSK